MIGIKAISSYVPTGSIDNIEQAGKFGETLEFVTGKIGARRLPIMAENEDTSDIACAAVRALCDKSDLDLKDIDALVVVTQNGDGAGLPHTAAIVQSKLGLSTRVAAFDISLGCSGYVYGLSALRGLMREAGLKCGVLVTADPYSKVVDREDRVTSLLFGDAATATWLGEGGIWTFGPPLLETDGTGAEHLRVSDRVLKMNGRQVFNFAVNRVAAQINRCLEDRGMTSSEVDLFCLHQGSAFIVNTIANQFGGDKSKFPVDIDLTGNTVSSSIPLLLEKHVVGSEHTKVVISGFGVGLSWATNLLVKGNT